MVISAWTMSETPPDHVSTIGCDDLRGIRLMVLLDAARAVPYWSKRTPTTVTRGESSRVLFTSVAERREPSLLSSWSATFTGTTASDCTLLHEAVVEKENWVRATTRLPTSMFGSTTAMVRTGGRSMTPVFSTIKRFLSSKSWNE